MKKKIKTWLIHLLGGVTASESQERGVDRSFVGAYVALTIIKKYSESLRQVCRRMVRACVQADLQTIRFSMQWS